MNELDSYIRKVNLNYNFWRKFRDCLSEIKRNNWPEHLLQKAQGKLFPLIDVGDYVEFLLIYRELEKERLEWKYKLK